MSVVEWYEGKTEGIISKYGPGPRIHFHTGIFEAAGVLSEGVEALRSSLVKAQDALVERLVGLWFERGGWSPPVLDAGCGLGGTSIYLAQKLGCPVVALTNVPTHVDLIKSYAKEAGVGSLVSPVLSDACDTPADCRFRSVVAIESSCYFRRQGWFRHLTDRLQPGDSVHIFDSFTEDPEAKRLFDGYWLTDVGRIGEYTRVAEEEGFKLARMEDFTERTRGFWLLTVAHSQRLLDATRDPSEVKRLERSISWHRRVHGYYLEKRIRCAELSFRRV